MHQKLKTYFLQKIIKLLLALKRWSLPILSVYVVALTIGSLSRISSIPDLGFSFDDKIYHFLAYAVLAFLCFNFFWKRNIVNAKWFAVIAAVIYGIIIEGLQSVLTDFRTPDYFDVVANTLGALATLIVLQLYSKLKLN